MAFDKRKFSMNYSTGQPRLSTKITRRFSTHDPSGSGGKRSSFSGEHNSPIHRQFRNSHEGHKSHAGLDPTRASTGVICRYLGRDSTLSYCLTSLSQRYCLNPPRTFCFSGRALPVRCSSCPRIICFWGQTLLQPIFPHLPVTIKC